MANRALPGPVDYAQIPELAQRGVARVRAFFELLNHELATRDTLAEGGFSIADIAAVVTVDFARVVRVKPGDAVAAKARRAAGAGSGASGCWC